MAGVPAAVLNCEDKNNVLGRMKQKSEKRPAPCGLHKATKLNLTQLWNVYFWTWEGLKSYIRYHLGVFPVMWRQTESLLIQVVKWTRMAGRRPREPLGDVAELTILGCWGELLRPVTLESGLKAGGMSIFVSCRWGDPVWRTHVKGCCLR